MMHRITEAKFAAVTVCLFVASGCSSSVPPTKSAPTTKTEKINGNEKNPQPVYELRKGQKEGLPFFTVVNRGLKNYKHKADFPWYLHINITMKEMNSSQLPTQNEAKVLNGMEDRINAALGKVCRNHYIGRATWRGRRELFFYLDSPKAAHKTLQLLTAEKSPVRDFEYEMAEDKSWSKVKLSLQLS